MVIAAGKLLYKMIKSKGKKEERIQPKDSEALKITDDYVGGTLGDKLIKALKVYRETGETKILDELTKEEFKDITLVLEFSRKITTDFQIRYKREPHYTITYVKSLKPKEVTYMALFTYKIIHLINALHKGPLIHLYMAAPATLAFQIGQLIGIDLYRIQLYQLIEGNYYRIPMMSRKK